MFRYMLKAEFVKSPVGKKHHVPQPHAPGAADPVGVPGEGGDELVPLHRPDLDALVVRRRQDELSAAAAAPGPSRLAASSPAGRGREADRPDPGGVTPEVGRLAPGRVDPHADGLVAGGAGDQATRGGEGLEDVGEGGGGNTCLLVASSQVLWFYISHLTRKKPSGNPIPVSFEDTFETTWT